MRDGKQNGNRRCKRQMARSAAEVLPGKRHGRANRLPNYDNGVSCCARPGVGCERHGEHSAPAVGVGATCTANTAPPRAGGYCLPAEIKERPVLRTRLPEGDLDGLWGGGAVQSRHGVAGYRQSRSNAVTIPKIRVRLPF
jgi:hypothetical protein